MMCDSHGAIAVAHRRAPSSRTKHIHLRDMWVRQLVDRGDATLEYRPTGDHADVDSLTKPLVGKAFAQARKMMLLSEPDESPGKSLKKKVQFNLTPRLGGGDT